ncbi:sterol desaturase family protein [Acidisoma sp. S159]|jgi:sterol desaturase/sphingolipid hydroxylase (fatty acid hydroxylase superfamily)|uniref:sterol desaturase family protein n=1 Tax=Acidisoma sp. S159 TaxID=1747225 RepID=UPI00131A8982|nr:sterol desaturase family protein [Acidisoma sp. S159]
MSDIGLGSQTAKVRARERRDHWRPEKALQQAPVAIWPPRPVAALKFLFAYPGYLYPWNALYLGIAAITWFLLTPDLSRMETLKPSWMLLILARNAVILFLFVGAWHLRLYIQKSQGQDYKYHPRWPATGNQTFLFGNQVLDNMFWTFASAVPIWSAYEILTLWGEANGWLPYLSWHKHPIWFVLLMLAIPLFREIHFYLVHRIIHWPPLYRTVHKLHHKNVNVGPWSGLAMHPVEHVLYYSGVLIHWIIPSNPLHVIFHLQHLSFAPAQGHSGFERVVVREGIALKTDDYYHYLHHKYFECNYGSAGAIPTDILFGTFHDGSDECTERMNERFMARQKK